jgi:hypothetical protein
LKALILLIPLIVATAFAEPLSDRTGLQSHFTVIVDGIKQSVITLANFDVQNVTLEEDGRLVFDIKSSLQNNIGEIQIPKNVTRGTPHFYLDGKEMTAKILQNDKISFITLEFEGNGTHKLEVRGDYVPAKQPSAVDSAKTEKPDQLTVIVAAAGIVAAGGAISTFAFYSKRKSKQHGS